MKVALMIALISIAMPCSALPPECDIRNFPDFWADAQSRVQQLSVLLESAERKNPYSNTSTKPFRQSLTVCAAKRKSVFNDPTAASGSAGVGNQMKCEAILICSRLGVIEMQF